MSLSQAQEGGSPNLDNLSMHSRCIPETRLLTLDQYGRLRLHNWVEPFVCGLFGKSEAAPWRAPQGWSMHDAVEPTERECCELPLQFGHPHRIRLPRGSMFLLQFSQKALLHLLRTRPVFQVIAL